MNLLVSGTGVLLACVLFALVALATFRQVTLRNLSTDARIIARNTAAAIRAGDRQAAADTLAIFADNPDILSAQILAPSGEPFAQVARDPHVFPTPPTIPLDREQIDVVGSTAVLFAKRLMHEGTQLGVVCFEVSLRVVYGPIIYYAFIAAFVTLAAIAATLLASRFAKRAIARPVQELGELALRVSTERDYGVRATTTTKDPREVAALKDAFNGMLSGIETRDRSLQDAHDELEARVKQRTEELQASNQELEAFSHSVSHDLRAPLRHIAGFANLLEQHAGTALDERGHRYVKTIVEAAARMGRLIDDLLAFSRMGRATLAKQPVNLLTLVNEARTELAGETKGRHVHWEIQPLPAVEGDPALLRPVLVNLLSNALKYSATKDEARIEVGAEPVTNGEVVLYVRDNGVGFDMAYVHKLFGVFQRLHSTNEFPGTGIGLANVRRIIQRHGGRTWAVGKPGAGATFYFSLPVAAAAPVNSPTEHAVA